MPGEVRGLKRGAEWTRMTERAVRCDWLDQAARESVQVLGGAGGIRTGETCRRGAVDQPTRGEADDCFTRIGLGLLEKDREGVFW